MNMAILHVYFFNCYDPPPVVCGESCCNRQTVVEVIDEIKRERKRVPSCVCCASLYHVGSYQIGCPCQRW